jgi:hypothetical protein
MLQKQEPDPQQRPPQAWWKTETQAKTFRFSLLWLVAFYLGEIALLYFYLQLRFGHSMPLIEFLGLVVFITLSSLFLVLAFPVRVGETGIQGQTAFGTGIRLRWDELDQISRFNFLGLRYLRISSKNGGWALYLPLFLNDVKGFWEQVARFAEPENPLYRFGFEKKDS